LIEHHLDVIKTADHVIDLGPEGGHAGGEVVVTGSPEDIAACARSHTGRFLKEVLRKTPTVERKVHRIEAIPEAVPKKSVQPRKEKVKATVAPKPAKAKHAPTVPPQTFKAVITLAGTRAIITVPFDPNKLWGNRSRHFASGTINGHQYRGLLEPARAGFFISLGPSWRRDNELDAGAKVEVVLYPDGIQIDNLASDIAQALESAPEAKARFESLTSGVRKNINNWIEGAKRAETRTKRITEMIRFLKAPRRQQT
jgi:hypothetical protein